MERTPDFEGVDGLGVEEGLWGVVVVVSGQGVERFAIKVVMVIMTFLGRPTGDARSRSTGINFLTSW